MILLQALMAGKERLGGIMLQFLDDIAGDPRDVAICLISLYDEVVSMFLSPH
jgi:hypothetical protein